MNSHVATPSPSLKRTDFLPGYRAIERLGCGGYGEVWKAEAPGGLIKAVKLLYGFSHEQRASDELKSLERVKQVRHPFLLSLERIETIDNRLFIVTELADLSLKDCFNEHLRRGKNGIPRSELLSYLRDAADALDFMSEVHGLQHLDIKPENLLLVAGHIKVADFGLVKDVGRQTVSLVGGMTPIYAAPEVFHGRPSRYSDQYSLAVVYQQMVTATLPFAGASAAELTLQHLGDEPDLMPLAPYDRPTIARAMSKNPEHRFASCRTMVDALIQAETAAQAITDDHQRPKKTLGNKSAASEYNPTFDRSLHAEDLTSKGDTAQNSSITLELKELKPARVVAVPAPQVDPESFQSGPTLLVGIGGLAGTVLRHFKRRLAERFGDTAAIPSIATLLVDTDASELMAATHGAAAGRLTTQETLPVPLRRPQEYRSRHGQPFRWLSRRWLYNVPRSLKTEGLRPLGRLAFVDHARTIQARLVKALDDILDYQAIDESRTATGLPFDAKQLRVFLVASICGGTGSGMALDMAYMLQSLIEGRDVGFEGITGILLLGSSGRPRARELAAVNSFAWLTEYNHFNRPGAAYPGDPSCGLEPRDVDERAFRTAYFVELGDAGRPEIVDQRAGEIAEYICLDALSPAQSFLKGCRAAAQPSDGSPSSEFAALSTFGIAVSDATRNSAVDHVCGELAQKVVASWLGRQQNSLTTDSRCTPESDTNLGIDAEAPTFTSDVEQVCLAESSKLQLNAEGLTSLAAKLVEVELGASPKAFYQRLVLELRGSRRAVPLPAIVQAVDRMFGSQAVPGGPRSDEAVVLKKPLDAIVKPLLDKMESHLSNWLFNRLDDEALRLAGALDAATWFTTHLRDLAKALTGRSNRIAQHLDQSQKSFSAPEVQDSASEEAPFAYLQLQLQRSATGAALTIARRLATATTKVRDRLVAAGGSIRELAERLNETSGQETSHGGPSGQQDTADETRRRLAESLIAREAEWIAAVNRSVLESYTANNGGLYRSLCSDRARQDDLARAVEAATRRCISSVVSDTNLLDRLLGRGETARDRLEALLNTAQGDCLQFGGSVCHVIAAPHNAPWEEVKERLSALQSESVAVVRHPENQLVACTEVQDVSLPHLATAVIRNRRDYASFAQRVLSRKDVQWSNFMAAALEAPIDYELQTVVI